ncbi:uncharacterized protein LOC127239534 [Andrographis paniculata]|uniref:uncharacterized protein LOC127239534 n=1 Tax=Andrographis paniculata TaxID=175694 RepID=UPI0021E8793B|nr:uncharacterized protein LOC127239534 [Andrographis paniculata]XP_051113688.1 uncharacterized protein LOC127239534 [Andrographis paniculata]XP_051113689.1 uncharacterized protein LOC127239534 [Andrographis paniculata]
MATKSLLFQYTISLKHLQWRSNANALCRRTFARPPLLLRPHHTSLLPHPLPLHRRLRLPPPPRPPLLRRRLRTIFSTMSSMNSPEEGGSQASVKTVRMVIKGRVQGVFYRNWTIENAKELGLKGWVRNRRDGSVEALFSGSPEKVEEMEQRCRRGPPDAMVTGIQAFPSTDDPGNEFERKPTV